MKGDSILHIMHVAQNRMIESDIGRLSSENTSSGVMQGKKIIYFVPMSPNASKRSESL